MDPIEAYEFDRCGYLVIREMLTAVELAALRAAVDELEEHALQRVEQPPRKKSLWGPMYHILFTENLRHGGFRNQSGHTRKSLHVGYGPAWMMSQNMATMDEPQFILPQTLARYTDEQRALFVMQG